MVTTLLLEECYWWMCRGLCAEFHHQNGFIVSHTQ